MNKVRWGVLSTAGIGLRQVLPAMQQGEYCAVTAIASRSLDKAQAAAATLGIPKAYGSYEELLADPDDRRRLQPAAQPPARALVDQGARGGQARAVREADRPVGGRGAAHWLARRGSIRQLKVMEAFMYRHHPQWQRAKQIVRRRRHRRAAHDPLALLLLQRRPRQHPQHGRYRRRRADGHRLLQPSRCRGLSLAPSRGACWASWSATPASAPTAWPRASSTSGAARPRSPARTQLAPYQRVHIFGTTGRVEIEIPFNAPPDRPLPAVAPARRQDRRDRIRHLPTSTRSRATCFRRRC